MMGSYMGSGTSQVINYTPPQVNNFYNQGANYGQGYPQPQPQAPQGYGQGQTQNYSYPAPQAAPSYSSYPPAPQQDYGYNAPSVNNYYNQGSNYSAPQPAPSYSEPPTYSYPPAQGQGYNYNANVPIVNVYNQVQAPRYNNNNKGNKDYANLPAPRPYNNDKPYGQGMQMSPDFIKGFMMASLGMGMLAGQVAGNQYNGNDYGMGDAYCPPGMKKGPYDVQNPYAPKPKATDDTGTLPILKYPPSIQPNTNMFWGKMPPTTGSNNGVNAIGMDQQAVEEMSQFFFFFLAAASQSQGVEAPQPQQQAPQQQQEGFPFPPELLQLIQGYMN
jgi:hypothetical protein